jgi:hypothetical protein
VLELAKIKICVNGIEQKVMEIEEDVAITVCGFLMKRLKFNGILKDF